MTMTDPLDKLLRDAAGATPDPGRSRHFIRAGLAPELARRRRGERRARVRLTLAMAAALIVIMCGQLGSEDFVTTSETKMVKGRRFQVYKQGMGGQETWLPAPGASSDAQEPRGADWKAPDAALDEQEQLANDLLMAKAANEGVIVGLVGYQIGGESWYQTMTEFVIRGKFRVTNGPAEGQSEKAPKGLRVCMSADGGQNVIRVLDESHSRAPDYSLQMTFNGLLWDMDAWRIRLPGQPELVYLTGLRHDGVRSKDPEPLF
jgi:hypothetical protein